MNTKTYVMTFKTNKGLIYFKKGFKNSFDFSRFFFNNLDQTKEAVRQQIPDAYFQGQLFIAPHESVKSSTITNQFSKDWKEVEKPRQVDYLVEALYILDKTRKEYEAELKGRLKETEIELGKNFGAYLDYTISSRPSYKNIVDFIIGKAKTEKLSSKKIIYYINSKIDTESKPHKSSAKTFKWFKMEDWKKLKCKLWGNPTHQLDLETIEHNSIT